MKFQALAFDLDDTLIDTSRILVPLASQATFEAMKKQGLTGEYLAFEQFRKMGALSMSHQLIFRKLAELMGPPDQIENLTKIGIDTFYNPVLPKKLALLDGALENLKTLSTRYALYLVTSGVPETQTKKVQIAGIEKYFKKSFFMNGLTRERKKQAFSEMIQTLSIKPTELLSIGNRLSQEIRDAKELGAMTCYFKFGEHVGESPKSSLENPDFTIEKHSELISTCHL
jgi:putative hydrolase of the HAD superfamily